MRIQNNQPTREIRANNARRRETSAAPSALTSFLLVAAAPDDLRLDLLEEQRLEDAEVVRHRLVRVLDALQSLRLLAALPHEPEKVRVFDKLVVTGGAAGGWVWVWAVRVPWIRRRGGGSPS